MTELEFLLEALQEQPNPGRLITVGSLTEIVKEAIDKITADRINESYK